MGFNPRPTYSVARGASSALQYLAESCRGQIPSEFLDHVSSVQFISKAVPGDDVYFPCPIKEQEATAAIKALEGCAAAAIADLRYGSLNTARDITVDMDLTACFLMSAYVSTIDGMDKQTPGVKAKLPDTDLNQAQSILYRRLSANLYATGTPGEYYHIHGSLEASTTLSMLGLPTHWPDLTDYRECIDTIEAVVRGFTVAELEELNAQHRQAGAPALKWDVYRSTPHGSVLSKLPPLTLTRMEDASPPALFPRGPVSTPDSRNSTPAYPSPDIRGALEGIKVLELCRVIAGPSIGRSLAAHGASVLKITSPKLSDVPFFQVDVNTGKHCCSLDLKTAADREVFSSLLAEADVVLDGYRPGALSHLGVGPKDLALLGTKRGKGYVYVAEDCFGGTGLENQVAKPEDMAKLEWKHRPGWQQIADCVTGVAWAQGQFMGLDEPVIPPFPMSDYGTGALGALGALAGLWQREKQGGSWACRTSLSQYDIFALSLGLYPTEVQEQIKDRHNPDFFGLRHADSVDEVGRRALKSLKQAHPQLFSDNMMVESWSDGFGAQIRWPKEAIAVDGIRIAHSRPTRPNGADKPRWEDCGVDEIKTEDGLSKGNPASINLGLIA